MTIATRSSILPRMQTLLFLNGVGLFTVGLAFGWVWFFHLLGEIVLWPLPIQIEVNIPGDARSFRMGHMEAITQSLMLMALAFGGQFMALSKKEFTALFWSALITAWLFTLPAMANTFFGTRGLAFGGGPFKESLANDVIFILGWPPVLCVHILFGLAAIGLFRHLKTQQA
ncbi:MAG: hypothetical protein COA62_07195 [Rhodobiaceae bacterium]|nr:MAG: hypothetical protein COA62_07195 [Rhodobiaceae bacterium]